MADSQLHQGAESYPLHWPQGRPRTKRPKASAFKTGRADARDGLFEELRRLGARSVVVSTNVRTYNRGGREIPYANQTVDDPGVAVYFLWEGESYVFACDEWRSVAENMQAVRKTIEAIRGIARWGTGDMMRAAFGGFKALPERGSGAGWWETLGVEPDATPEDIRRAYKARAMETHPDRGGNADAFRAVQDALHQGLAARTVSPALA